jgi:hypothetical protein
LETSNSVSSPASPQDSWLLAVERQT